MTDQSPSADSARQPTAPNGPSVRRYLRHDNVHIWVPLCMAVSFFAYGSVGPLVARRMFPRFAARHAEKKWTLRDNLLEPLNVSAAAGSLGHIAASLYQVQRALEEAKADRDYCTIEKTHRLLEFARFKHPVLLTHMLRPMELKESAVAMSVDEPIGISERIATVLTQWQFSANYVWMMREGLEQDMRQRNISEQDITKTTLYLAGALEENALRRVLLWNGVYCTVLGSAYYILSARATWWCLASLTPIAAIQALYMFQNALPIYIHDKHAVAEMLRDRIGLENW